VSLLKHAVFFTKLLSVFTDSQDVRPVLNFGIISLARVPFEWRYCHHTSEVRATVILLSVQLNPAALIPHCTESFYSCTADITIIAVVSFHLCKEFIAQGSL